jgi:hypothetical protein
MTCTYQNCADCPHRPKSELSAKPFDRDVAMRSLEYSAVRLGMYWSSSDSDEIEIAAMPDITNLFPAPVAEALQARARMLREPCAAVIAREGRS